MTSWNIARCTYCIPYNFFFASFFPRLSLSLILWQKFILEGMVGYNVLVGACSTVSPFDPNLRTRCSLMACGEDEGLCGGNSTECLQFSRPYQCSSSCFSDEVSMKFWLPADTESPCHEKWYCFENLQRLEFWKLMQCCQLRFVINNLCLKNPISAKIAFFLSVGWAGAVLYEILLSKLIWLDCHTKFSYCLPSKICNFSLFWPKFA